MPHAHVQASPSLAGSVAASPSTAVAAPLRVEPEAQQQQSTVRSAGVVASTTMLSRVLGLLRDVGAAALFGAGWVWDAFVLAFLLPNLFRRLFGEGSLAAAFVPVYTQLRESHGGDAAARLLSNALCTLIVFLAAVVTVLVALGFALPEGAWGMLFGASDAHGDAKLELFRLLMPILLPFVVLVCATALIGAALNVHGNFFVPAFASVLLNIVWLAGIGVAVLVVPATQPQLACLIVAGAILVGGAAGLAHHLYAIRRALRATATAQPAIEMRVELRDPQLREVGRRMGPAIIGLGVLQISVLLDSVIAEIFVPGDGAVSALYFGNRLMQLPLALIGVAMAVAIFPVLSRHASREDHASLLASLSHGTRVTLFLSVPACIGLVVLAGPIVGTVYGWGAFDGEAHLRTTAVLACYAVGLVAASLRMLQTRAFYALGDTRTPSAIAIRLVALNVVLNLILVHTPLREAGLALSTSLVAWFGFVWLERRLVTKLPSTGVPSAIACLVRSTVASTVMIAAALLAAHLLVPEARSWNEMAWAPRIASLGVVLIVAVVTFAAVSAVLRTPELAALTAALRRRRQRDADGAS